MDAEVVHIEVYGLLNDLGFVKAKCCAEDLYKRDPDCYPEPLIVGMLQFDWDLFLDAKRKELRGETWVFQDTAITFANQELVGGAQDFVTWAETQHGWEDFRPPALYETLTEEGYKNFLNSKNHEYVFLDISIGNEPAGRLVIELFSDLVPKTCLNFKALCTGEMGEGKESGYKLHFLNSIFHRVVRNGWIQGGDIYHGRGNGGESIFGPLFEDENFAVKHDRRGIVGFANKGRHTNGSQFYICLQPSPWMNTRYVAFGKIIEGTETLAKMEAVETMNERPNSEVKVTDCGVLTFEF